jgi:glutathione synthase/RimK-type ligase-like ATP-grasp enzyme
MIVVVSSKPDSHATAVLAELEAMKEPATLLDLAEFPLLYRLSMNYGNSHAAGPHLRAETGSIDFSQVRSIWWRRPQPFRLDPDLRDPAYVNFAINESHEAITGLWHSLDVFWINNPACDAAAQRKAHQLHVAQKLGISIPETLITNDPRQAQQFIERHERVICKAFSATQENWRETRLVGPEELANLERVRLAPVIFQRYVEAVYDLRITVVGNDIFPAAIYSQETAYAVDCRIDIGRARIEPVRLPEPQQDQLHKLMDTLGLVYGAVDMRLQPDGTYVFLEVNPAGQFLFIETATKQPIARSLAVALARSNTARSRASVPGA